MSAMSWKTIERECLREVAAYIKQRCHEKKSAPAAEFSAGLIALWSDCFSRALLAESQQPAGAKETISRTRMVAALALQAEKACMRGFTGLAKICACPAEEVKRIFCEQVWEHMFERHGGSVERFLAHSGLSGDPLADSYQETWRSLWEQLLSGHGHKTGYLFMAAAASKITIRKRLGLAYPATEPQANTDAPPAPANDSGWNAIAHAARAALLTLKPRERAIFLAIHVDGVAPATLAFALNTSPDNARRIANRAYRQLAIACARAAGFEDQENFVRPLAEYLASRSTPAGAPESDGAEGDR